MRIAIAVMMVLALVACSGPKGPTGPQGPPGEPGPGTRIVYAGWIGATGIRTVEIPELDFASMPLIGVYFHLATTEWVQVNTFLTDSLGVPALLEFAIIRQQEVELYSSTALQNGGFVEYRIVLVI